VRAVRRELGKNFIVMTDANQGYSIDVGIKAGKRSLMPALSGSKSRCSWKISKVTRFYAKKVIHRSPLVKICT
jgi:hypothetical protein